ncbi:MFS transporter [Vulcanibacillus modesticaldus]|uniref:MFS transporter n=1 Tax=Vulcanibacillus modesticaldus TaxID=337097 RepID=A0A1D2YTL6_9BACI|nr:MFS transporter [Vulcanibacillus modesticaldus]OEF99043.1 MFS transporter [Vulcanibacillus modesticaldus]
MNKKAVFGWTMYDFANSAFATTIMAAILPIFFSDVAAGNLSKSTATAYWGYIQALAMLIVAILAPVLGAIADYSRSKKKFLTFFVILGAISTSLLYFAKNGDYLLVSILFILGTIGFSGGNVFYDAFLPEIVPKKDMDYISAKGYAFGYIGGGILLLINLMMILKPELFHIPSPLKATQISFLTVGIWWIIFTIPLLIYVHEKKETAIEKNSVASYVSIGINRVTTTFKEITKYRELLKFLIAFWLYNDGISTIIKMATIYGREIGIGKTALIAALLITQFIGIPFAFIFGKLAGKIGSKTALYITLWTYVAIVMLGYFMQTATHFYILAIIVGFVQGGSQAISRSIYGNMIPINKTAEFYGFYGISSKFAAIFGPFLFGLVGSLTGSSRFGIFSLVLFFLIGIWLLTKVNIEKGQLEANTVA